MLNNMKDLKCEFENIDIPKELDDMINKTIKNDNKSRSNRMFKTLVSSAAVIGLLIVPVNLIPSFADSISNIPVIGAVAKIFTVETYTKSEENISKDVNMPAVSDLSDESYEEKINSIIAEKTNEFLEEATIRAEEYKEAYLETGGTEEGYAEKDMEVVVDYEIFLNNNETLSFLVYGYESLAAAYAEYNYYNLDLKTNTSINLRDLLGDDYQAIITQSVLEDVKVQKEAGEIIFFEDIDAVDFLIREDIDFYINSDKNIVVIFDKYEIAAGFEGRLEFIIIK